MKMTKIIKLMDAFLNLFDPDTALGRILIFLTAPIWISISIVVFILAMIYSFLLMFIGSPFYWICTGKSLLDSKYNFFKV